MPFVTYQEATAPRVADTALEEGDWIMDEVGNKIFLRSTEEAQKEAASSPAGQITRFIRHEEVSREKLWGTLANLFSQELSKSIISCFKANEQITMSSNKVMWWHVVVFLNSSLTLPRFIHIGQEAEAWETIKESFFSRFLEDLKEDPIVKKNTEKCQRIVDNIKSIVNGLGNPLGMRVVNENPLNDMNEQRLFMSDYYGKLSHQMNRLYGNLMDQNFMKQVMDLSKCENVPEEQKSKVIDLQVKSRFNTVYQAFCSELFNSGIDCTSTLRTRVYRYLQVKMLTKVEDSLDFEETGKRIGDDQVIKVSDEKREFIVRIQNAIMNLEWCDSEIENDQKM